MVNALQMVDNCSNDINCMTKHITNSAQCQYDTVQYNANVAKQRARSQAAARFSFDRCGQAPLP